MKIKQRLLLIILIIILISAVIVAFLLQKDRNTPSGNIHTFFHLYSDLSSSVLTQILSDFSGLYPEVQIDNTNLPYQDLKKEINIFINNETEEDKEPVSLISVSGRDINDLHLQDDTFTPWTGSRWRLYYNSSRLLDFGLTEEDITGGMDLDFNSFCEYFSEKLPENSFLFAFSGKQPMWWLAWIQHLQLSLSKGNQPDDYNPGLWETALKEWDKLIEKGLINNNFKSVSIPDSFYMISTGEALFVLSDNSVYTVYTPRERENLNVVFFPGSAADKWIVGSDFYLGITGNKEDSRNQFMAANLLKDYLFSDPVRNILLEKSGVVIYPPENSGKMNEIPSLTLKIREEGISPLLNYFSSY